MEEAIEDYRVDEDDPDYDSDVNDAVDSVQDTVCFLFILTHCSPMA